MMVTGVTDSPATNAAARSPLGEWGRFVGILLLVVSPLLLLGAALEALAWRIGETMPMAMIAKWQDGAPDRVWRGGDGHSFLNYKLARIADLKPEVIALGSSRANGFAGAAVAPYSFYNAGSTTWTIEQDRRFLELVARDGYVPRVLIFNLDYWMFSAGFDHYWSNRFDEKPAGHVASLMRVVGRLREDPAGLWHRLSAAGHEHGLYAVLTGEGFRADGSLPAKSSAPDARHLEEDGTDAGTPPAVFADHLAPGQIGKFEAFAALAKARQVALIGVQLPFYAKILDRLNGDPQAGIWHEFEAPEWRRHMADAGVVVFDFADMPEFRDKPAYFIDSLDPDARVVGKVMRQVMADPRVKLLLPKTEVK